MHPTLGLGGQAGPRGVNAVEARSLPDSERLDGNAELPRKNCVAGAHVDPMLSFR
jgi:hypothetical protein